MAERDTRFPNDPCWGVVALRTGAVEGPWCVGTHGFSSTKIHRLTAFIDVCGEDRRLVDPDPLLNQVRTSTTLLDTKRPTTHHCMDFLGWRSSLRVWRGNQGYRCRNGPRLCCYRRPQGRRWCRLLHTHHNLSREIKHIYMTTFIIFFYIFGDLENAFIIGWFGYTHCIW